jgi:peptidyl-tRNA hydrolase, PTH1 family
MKLIVGLGNPGRKYENTRHNIGFRAAEYLAEFYDFDDFSISEKHNADIAKGEILEEKIIIAKPQTFMNLSGQAVRSVMQFYKIPTEDLIVISDDVTLPSGSLRIRKSGSAGGHNGLKSIIQELGTDEFLRIRLGIDPITPFKGNLEDYVLGKISDEEMDLMETNIKKLPELLKILFDKGIEEAMQKFN